MIKLSSLHIYPVKSFRGIELKTSQIHPKGPFMDRRFMAVDANGRFLSQRQHPEMSQVHTELHEDKVILKAKNHPPFTIKATLDGERRPVTIWNDTVTGIDQGDEAASWLKAALNMEARLVFMPDETFRKVDPRYAVNEKNEVSFADAYPVLVISEASLQDLNSKLEKPILMNRFRPNLVVSGCTPFEEDSWKKIRIGNVIFHGVKPCSRCVLTTVDQETGERGPEPLETLVTYRKKENKILFGQNLIPEDYGTVSVGDAVEVLEKHS